MEKNMTEENKKEGFIKIYRSIWKHPISEKPNYLSVWIYLISHANYSDKYTIINNKNVLIRRGEFISSLRKISTHFNLSISTVKYIIEYLKVEHMIEHLPNKNYSLFKIINYDLYNPLNTLLNTNETRIKTTNNIKNIKNNNYYVFKDGTRGFVDKKGIWKECDTYQLLGDVYKKELRDNKII